MPNVRSNRSASPVRGPRRAAALAAACALIAAGAAGAQVVKSKPLTAGLESGTEFVTLPSAPRGSLNARECRDCPSLRLEFTGETRFFIGKEAVSYEQLRTAAAQGDLLAAAADKQ
jgi:hypothetical protein